MLPLTAGKTFGILCYMEKKKPFRAIKPKVTTKPFPRHHISMDLLGKMGVKMLFASVPLRAPSGRWDTAPARVPRGAKTSLLCCELQPSCSSSLLEPLQIVTPERLPAPFPGRISAALTPALGKEGLEIALLYHNSWPAQM